MPEKPDRVSIKGSARAEFTGAHLIGAIPDKERFRITIQLRPKNPLGQSSAGQAMDDVLPQQRRYLTRKELAEQQGADPADISKVKAFAKSHHLRVVKIRPDQRSMILSGKAGAFSKAFGITLQRYEYVAGTFRGRTGEISVPSDLEGIIQGVFGLDNRPQARPHFKVHASNPGAVGAVSPADQAASFTTLQLAQIYSFPQQLDGSGQCIAIIELGGGYRTADLNAYFSGLSLPTPNVKTVRVDCANNKPSTQDSADGEVMLDIEVAGTIAPKASIVVYFAPNTDRGFLDAITRAVHDSTNKPSVISISWGGPESNWTGQTMAQFNQAFQTAASLGITVCVTTGDHGSSDGATDGLPHVDFPASSPYVLACGGTRLTASGTTISSETVWNDGPDSSTGGGVSTSFPLPSYQQSVNVPGSGGLSGRGVPDVAGDADPATGYQVRVDGYDLVIGGTSAVAPLWAGLIALFNQKIGTPIGFLNPLIYGSLSGKGLFNDVISGNNGAFSAGPGWDACTGWGSPIGTKLLTGLGG